MVAITPEQLKDINSFLNCAKYFQEEDSLCELQVQKLEMRNEMQASNIKLMMSRDSIWQQQIFKKEEQLRLTNQLVSNIKKENKRENWYYLGGGTLLGIILTLILR